MTFYQNAPRLNAPDPATLLPQLAPSPNSGSPGSDTGFGGYMNSDKSDVGYGTPEEDTSLTTQTLNADGTPKRPMNAFMIFARKRRPQLSAENQSMRTGEISKILSKEWNSMPPSDKQYYQDQAKLLKDSFNSKYPDYVYRRRPNNTRKKRKADGRDNSLDIGDGDGGEENKEPSEGDDLALPVPSRASTYAYPQADPMYRQGGQDHRAVYALDRPGSGGGYRNPRSSSLPSPHPTLNQRYPYSSSSPSYTPEPSVQADWTETGRMAVSPASGWYGSDRNYSPAPRSSSAPGWPDSGNTTATASGTGYSFPTLNSPFYLPGKSDSNAYSAGATDTDASHYASSHDHTHGFRYGGARYNHRYEDSPNLGHTDQGPELYPSGHHRPRVHTSHSPTGSEPSSHPSNPSHLPSSQYGYWAGDRDQR